MLHKETIVRRLYEDVLNGGDLESITHIISTGAVDHAPRSSSSLPIGSAHGLSDFLNELCDAFPDVHWVIEQMADDGDAVVVETSVRGSHHGEFRGIRAIGRQFTLRSIDILRIHNGKIVEHWGELDFVSLQGQLDARHATRVGSANEHPSSLSGESSYPPASGDRST